MLDRISEVGRENVPLLPYQQAADCEFKFYYEREMIMVREERIPFISKKLKVNQASLKFVQAASVFADWQYDTPQMLR